MPPQRMEREQQVSFAMSSDEVRRHYAGGLQHEDIDALAERLTGRRADDVPAAELLPRLAVTARHLRALYTLATRLDPAEGVNDVAQVLADCALDVFSSDRCIVVFLGDDRSTEVRGLAHRGETAPNLGSSRSPILARAVVEAVVDSGQAVVSTNAPDDTRFDGSESLMLMRVHSLLAAPLLRGDGCIGVIQIDDRTPGLQFQDEDLRLLIAIAAMGARAVEHALLMAEQKRTIEELRRARAQLLRSEQLSIVGATTSALAHEIRNQLGPMMMVDFLRRRFPDDTEVAECVDLLMEANQHILRLLDEMRGYATSDSPTLQLDCQTTHVGDLLESVARFLRFDRACQDVELTTVCPRPIIADLDPDRVKQVLFNLVRNAVQALVSSGTQSPSVQLCATLLEPTHCVLEVRDNGPGIPVEIGERVFEPFFTTKSRHGTGLGLDICRHIVERHGGRLSFESASSGGTVMRVELPLTRRG